jgi:hypothetical protein
MTSSDDNPLKALRETLMFSSQDWGEAADFAWIYGIVCGWQDEEDDYHPSLQADFGWSDEQVARLKRLRAAFADLEAAHA